MECLLGWRCCATAVVNTRRLIVPIVDTNNAHVNGRLVAFRYWPARYWPAGNRSVKVVALHRPACKLDKAKKMNRRTFITSVTAFAGSLCGLFPVLAQNSSRPIRVLVPLAPGGAVDPYARLVADQMAKTLGRVVIVEHKPGANGNMGTQFVAREPADGNLILVTTQAMTEINPSAFSDAKWSLDDFIPLIRGVEAPLVLVAHPSVPAKTLDELVAWVKRNPGKLSYSSYTAGTPSHFLGFQFNQRFGLDLVHVPAKGSGFQATDLMAGHVLFGFAQVQSTMQLIHDGKLNAIAVTSATAIALSPECAELSGTGPRRVHKHRLVWPDGPRRNAASRRRKPLERCQDGPRQS